MIKNKDRSNYFGASDTKYIVGNWQTKTFEKWWLTKIGINKSNFENEYTKAGNNYEHKILDKINVQEKDKQIIKGRLRVNLDGNTKKTIYEVKTYKLENGFDLKKHKDYVEQVNVQMYCYNSKEAYIVAYGLLSKDYENYFNEIEEDRIKIYRIDYDEEFISNIYLPKLNYLTSCLEKGILPKKIEK